MANPCHLAQSQPKDKSQLGSGDGPSDTGDDDADSPQEGGCKAPTPTVAFNSLYFWQTSFGDMLGTLVHEYGHFANPSAGDSGLRFDLGISKSPDSTTISKKLTKDCFSGVKNP